MKRLAVFIAVLLALTLIPSAHAALRIQGVGSSLLSFDGPTHVDYKTSGFSGVYRYDGASNAYVSASSRVGGPGVAFSLQRPVNVQNHYFERPSYNYRSYSYGDWQVRNAQASWPDRSTNIQVGQRYGQYGIRGNIGGYTGGSAMGYYNAGYDGWRASNSGYAYRYPTTYSNYGYGATQSAYTRTGWAYN